jgi:hypothetical protein
MDSKDNCKLHRQGPLPQIHQGMAMVSRVIIVVISSSHLLQAMVTCLLHIPSQDMVSKAMPNRDTMLDTGMLSLLRWTSQV